MTTHATAAPAPSSPDFPRQPEQGPNHSWRKRIIAIAAGVAVVATAGFVGIEATAGNSAPKKSDKASSASSKPTKSPEATATAKPEALTVQSVEIPAGLSPVDTGKAFISRLSDWNMAGATPENRDAWYAAGGTDAYALQIAAKNGAIYAEALFGKNWQSDPKISRYVLGNGQPNSSAEASNADDIQLWFDTSTGMDKRDIQAFRTSYDVPDGGVTILSQTANSVSERITMIQTNNASYNRADQIASGTSALNDKQYDVYATFTNTNGAAQIVSNFNIAFHQ